MTEVNPLSKEAQLARSPGRENRKCATTGEIVRNCKCFSCQGRRNRRKGQRKQGQARKQLEKAFGAQAGPSMMATAHEENWRLPVRSEVKAGGMAKTVDTFYRKVKAQSDAEKAIADIRPFMAVAMPDGTTDGLAVIRISALNELWEEARRER